MGAQQLVDLKSNAASKVKGDADQLALAARAKVTYTAIPAEEGQLQA